MTLGVPSLIDSPELSRPKAALICNSLHKKWIGFTPQNERFTPRYDEMAEICLSLTALRGSCPVPVGYWWEAADWIPCVGLNGYRVSLPSTEGRVGHDIQILIDADRVTARETALFFQRLNQDSKARLHVVLDRLNRSRRRLSLVDRAIELGIAGETLFLYEPGRNHTTELAFRMKLRAAWFLEETPERRAGVMKKMDALYKYRSAAVHTGRLDDDPDTHKALNDGEELIALATQKVLAQGGFPNWANLVLGST